jgi:hypothetical protein
MSSGDGARMINSYNTQTINPSPPPKNPLLLPFILVVIAFLIIVIALVVVQLKSPPSERSCGLTRASDCPFKKGPTTADEETLLDFYDRCTALQLHSPDECLDAWDKVHPELLQRGVFGIWHWAH